MQGPRVHCDEDGSPEVALFTPCTGQPLHAYKAVTGMNSRLRVDPSNRGWGNNFTASFHREIRMGPKGTFCKNETLTTLNCHLTLATYDVHIRNEENGTSVYETKIVDDQEFWEEENGTAPMMDYYHFFHNTSNGADYEVAINQTRLTKEFAITQSYSIGHAALNTLIGNVTACTYLMASHRGGTTPRNSVLTGLFFQTLTGILSATRATAPRSSTAPTSACRIPS